MTNHRETTELSAPISVICPLRPGPRLSFISMGTDEIASRDADPIPSDPRVTARFPARPPLLASPEVRLARRSN